MPNLWTQRLVFEQMEPEFEMLLQIFEVAETLLQELERTFEGIATGDSFGGRTKLI